MKKNKSIQKVKKALEQMAAGNKKTKEHAERIIKEEGVKESKAIHRTLLIQMGLYGVHKSKVFKSKKSYNRKKKQDLDE